MARSTPTQLSRAHTRSGKRTRPGGMRVRASPGTRVGHAKEGRCSPATFGPKAASALDAALDGVAPVLLDSPGGRADRNGAAELPCALVGDLGAPPVGPARDRNRVGDRLDHLVGGDVRERLRAGGIAVDAA